ncbi:MAG: cobyric acid synthase CobQ, partial [Selenomonadaceae bacterium]|nr:cobyric acid synthase CobQ [Selenomonadaceae bacterium]
MAKYLMFQGTSSHVGKSILTTAMCRIFFRAGLNVAPFKAANMALNSYVTADGLEMGRAQVAQAEAAGLAPRVEMNPVLLKPTGNSTSQVIINGKPVGVMSAAEY